MEKKKVIQLTSIILGAVIALSVVLAVVLGTQNNDKPKKDAITIMTEELSGLYNPFYATAGADMDVVGMTQISMLSTDKDGNPVAGDEYATVVKDFVNPAVDTSAYNSVTDETTYTFVIKNGLKFSDGKPLTMNDVMFNIYEYLDPVYTGSSTMYSIDIKGLTKYRMQKNYSSETEQDKENQSLMSGANKLAQFRLQELIDLYELYGEKTEGSYSLTEAQMKALIKEHEVGNAYIEAVATKEEQKTLTNADYQAMLLEDYELALTTFREELESDFKAAKESYDLTTMPYSEWADELSNDVFKFLLYERYIKAKYADDNGRPNKLKIEKFEGTDYLTTIKTKEQAINKVYNDKVVTELNAVLDGWATAATLRTRFAAKALEVLLHQSVNTEDGLDFKFIEGVVSLGHTTNVQTVTVNGTPYTVAHEHNEDGTPKNKNEYDVLQITINGQDPKAIYNFGFTVAPAHYYTADEEHPNGREINIKEHKFGVEWSDSDFQMKTISSYLHNKIPVGAGAYKASNRNNSDTPAATEFVSENIVYYKANNHFMFPVKTEKLRLQVVSSTNALDKLENGEVDYVTPQFTAANSARLKNMASNGFERLDSWQLGYGYIGINAGLVDNVYIRRAIMASMQTSLACEYYEFGTCKTIAWPMSTVSWAYPYVDPEAPENQKEEIQNGRSYTQWTDPVGSTTFDDAKAEIQDLMRQANAAPGDSRLKIRFTIAGASITEHPTYAVFKQSAEILNSLGWDIDVKADSQALTKLSTGALQVWAAAWGSTIDPDMYQVYHIESTATSVYAWGYREIKTKPTSFEYKKVVELSGIIDQAREKMTQDERRPLYQQAMGCVLELAVELPVYQRRTLYAYNSNTIKGINAEAAGNPYASPLEKIWDLEIVK